MTMSEEVRPGVYQHFKGGRYQVFAVVTHSETLEPHVVYRTLYGDRELWVRPLAMFTEVIEHDGVLRPRFRRDNDQTIEDGTSMESRPSH